MDHPSDWKVSSIVLSSGINESCRRCIQGLDVSMSLPSSFFFFPTLTHLVSLCVSLSTPVSLCLCLHLSVSIYISLKITLLSFSISQCIFVRIFFISLSFYSLSLSSLSSSQFFFFMRTASSKRQFIFWTSYFRSKLSQAMPMEW